MEEGSPDLTDMRFTKTDLYLETTHRIKETIYSAFRTEGSSVFNVPYAAGQITFCTNRKIYSGGICDRFKGMISAYAWAKANGYRFTLYHKYPYDIASILKPVSYDWEPEHSVRTAEKDKKDVRLFIARGERGRRFLNSDPAGKPVIYFGNIDILPLINSKYKTCFKWGELFNELFKPSDTLQSEIERYQPKEQYIAVVFRFQQLLGDFKEKHYKRLSRESDRRLLIRRCLDTIEDLRSRNNGMHILVTSDSQTFLEEAALLTGVSIVPGKRVHVQFSNDGDLQDYMKSFVDFFLLSRAEKIFRVRIGDMYNTEFPVCAARLSETSVIDIVRD